MVCCFTRPYSTVILLLVASLYVTGLLALGKYSDGSAAKVVVIHSFREGIQHIVNTTTAVLQYDEKWLNVQDIFLDKYEDTTGSKLFSIGSGLRKQNDIKVVIGPSSSAGVFLLHPHLILAEIPHVSPVVEDPVFEATDRFPLLLRMNMAYQNQVSL